MGSRRLGTRNRVIVSADGASSPTAARADRNGVRQAAVGIARRLVRSVRFSSGHFSEGARRSDRATGRRLRSAHLHGRRERPLSSTAPPRRLGRSPAGYLRSRRDATAPAAVGQRRGSRGCNDWEPTSTVLLGDSATEQELKRQPLERLQGAALRRARHREHKIPGASALLLRPSGAEDGLFQAREILELRLGADLVTLSACDTGSGAVYGQEGVASLVRPFLAAGAAAWSRISGPPMIGSALL